MAVECSASVTSEKSRFHILRFLYQVIGRIILLNTKQSIMLTELGPDKPISRYGEWVKREPTPGRCYSDMGSL